MKFTKMTAALALPTLFFAACSSDSSSSAGEAAAVQQETSTTAPQSAVDIKVEKCAALTDAALQAKIADATTEMFDFAYGVKDIGDEFDNIRQNAKTAKDGFRSVLATNPSSCEAQFGLALALVADVVNNEELVDIVKTLSDNTDDDVQFSLLHIDNRKAMSISAGVSMKNSKLVTDRVQNIIATAALPAVDSAIIYMQNVAQAVDFEFKTIVDEDGLVMGHGEFAISLGALKTIKAVLTAVVSFNLNASKDNSYNWVVTASDWLDNEGGYGESMSDEQKAAFNHAIGLLNEKSSFLTVDSKWKSAYTAIPALLDSAVSNMKDGFNYMIANADKPRADGYRALVEVGSGEYADVSTRDIEKTVDVLDSIQKGIRGVITVEINDQMVQLDASKFFNITDGFQKFLPYHKFVPVEQWGDVFHNGQYETWLGDTDYRDYMYYAEAEIRKTVDSLVPNATYMHVYIDYVSFESGDDWGSANVDVDGCEYSLNEYVWGYNKEPKYFPAGVSYKLSSDVCKVENGLTVYKAFPEDLMPNMFNFTDAKGNVTVSCSDFVLNNDIDAAYIEKNIIFPDPTFGGVFPGMTQHQLAQMIAD